MKRLFKKFVESWWLAPTCFAAMPMVGFGLAMVCGLLAMGLEKAGVLKEFPEAPLKAVFVGALGLALVFAVLSVMSVRYSLCRRRWKRTAATLALLLAMPMGLAMLCAVGPSPEDVYGPDYGKPPVSVAGDVGAEGEAE